jgi:RNA polymerase sigma-70 factor, ECF subfamily
MLATLDCVPFFDVPLGATAQAEVRFLSPVQDPVPFFEALAQRHEPALYAMALRLCGSPADARDLVQDTLERALRKIHTFTPGSHERAWLLTLLHNLFIDRCRALKREARADEAPEEMADTLAAEPETEEGPAWGALTHEDVEAALEKLAPDFRVVYRLHAVEGRSYQEISEQLGIAKNTVGTRLIRARRKLRVLLGAPETSEPEGSVS